MKKSICSLFDLDTYELRYKLNSHWRRWKLCGLVWYWEEEDRYWRMEEDYPREGWWKWCYQEANVCMPFSLTVPSLILWPNLLSLSSLFLIPFVVRDEIIKASNSNYSNSDSNWWCWSRLSWILILKRSRIKRQLGVHSSQLRVDWTELDALEWVVCLSERKKGTLQGKGRHEKRSGSGSGRKGSWEVEVEGLVVVAVTIWTPWTWTLWTPWTLCPWSCRCINWPCLTLRLTLPLFCLFVPLVKRSEILLLFRF